MNFRNGTWCEALYFVDTVVLGVVDVGHHQRQQAPDFQDQPLRIFEMNSATVKTISQGSYIGLGLPRDEDCRVPAGATVLEFKTCENCGRPFTRPKAELQPVILNNPDDQFSAWGREEATKTIYRDTGIKFCNECHQRYLMPVDDVAYREILPKIDHHPQRLVHYDDSLQPAKKKLSARVRIALPVRKSNFGHLGDWKLRLRLEIKERGPLSIIEMLEITGHKNYNTLKVNLIRSGVAVVGCVWPRYHGTGCPAKLYTI